MSAQYPSFEEIKDVNHKLTEMRAQYHRHHDLFTFQWWLLLALLVVPWIIWWKLVDKSRVREILLYGITLAIIIVILDDIGGELGLWSYPYQLIRFIPRLNPVDFSVLPVFHMLVYQYFRSWKSFFVANVIMAFLIAFIAEPIFSWIGIYDLDNWKYFYSFPIYIVIACFVRWCLELIHERAHVLQQKQDQ
ncbi:CBO0543 family protein [Paenibacillus sp. HJGM_3]|uniref:CBO0543 family protein n=1 Tax=Paenibacillus sp. HJGM_3 TaxID=3379816 RepID=UPI00385EF4A7